MKNSEKIQFCINGSVIVGQSEKGLCAVFLGSEQDVLKRSLQERFPKALLAKGDATVEKVLSHVINFINNPAIEFDLPLDERGTDFQLLVWKALREIPCGLTASYSDIAKKIGSPKAFRAVAGACAANPLAVITPCHRVIRTDGSLSGYFWGIDIKKKLLDLEKTLVEKSDHMFI